MTPRQATPVCRETADQGAAGECLLSCHHGLGVFAFLGTISTVILGLVPRIQRAAYS
jgi:hypothetical protein